jgi:hypothetical protein
MIRHLSEEQISAVLLGEKGSDSAAHLEKCAHCRRQVEQFGEVMGAFRGAVREWSEVQPGVLIAPGSRARILAPLARVCGVALVVLMGLIGYRLSSTPSRRTTVSSSNVSADADTLLLDHVKADVSRSVPPGMESLLGFTSERTTQR